MVVQPTALSKSSRAIQSATGIYIRWVSEKDEGTNYHDYRERRQWSGFRQGWLPKSMYGFMKKYFLQKQNSQTKPNEHLKESHQMSFIKFSVRVWVYSYHENNSNIQYGLSYALPLYFWTPVSAHWKQQLAMDWGISDFAGNHVWREALTEDQHCHTIV